MKVTRRFGAIGIGDLGRVCCEEGLDWLVLLGDEDEGVWNWLQGNMR